MTERKSRPSHSRASDKIRTTWSLSCTGAVGPLKEDKDVDREGAMEDITEGGKEIGTREEEEEDSHGAARGNGRLRPRP